VLLERTEVVVGDTPAADQGEADLAIGDGSWIVQHGLFGLRSAA
jgi:hypothetical protein